MAEASRRQQEKLAGLEASLADRRCRRGECARQRHELAPRLEQGRRLAQAKEQGRWWTMSWWRAVLRKDLPARLAELDALRQQIDSDLTALDQEIVQLDSDRQQAEQAFATQRRQWIDI